MRLGIDATNIRQGGGLTHLSQCLAAADPAQNGFSLVTVWCSSSTAAALPERSWLRTCSAPWMEASLPRRILAQQWLLPRYVRSARCDAVFFPGGTLSLLCSVPTVTMSQNMLPFEPVEAARFGRWSWMRFKMALLRYTQGRSFRRADGVIFLTRYAQAQVSQALGGLPKATALVPHGIEPRFLQAPRAPRPLAACSVKKPFRLLYVSIVMPYKHQVEVAYAACQLRAEGVPLEVRFVGASRGRYGREFRVLLDHLDPRREFLLWSGAEPFQVLHGFYQNADGFVFASSCENLPNILIEAMAAGLPIACADRGPMSEILGIAGIYFDPESPASIAEALRKMARSTEKRAQWASLAWSKA
uniref:glycosyltransferase n=1 Tax=Polynucleobacter sp. TaxID=2029855 RepID=UPI004047C98A